MNTLYIAATFMPYSKTWTGIRVLEGYINLITFGQYDFAANTISSGSIRFDEDSSRKIFDEKKFRGEYLAIAELSASSIIPRQPSFPTMPSFIAASRSGSCGILAAKWENGNGKKRRFTVHKDHGLSSVFSRIIKYLPIPLPEMQR